MSDKLLVSNRDKILLNGWWDFIPIAHSDLAIPIIPDAVPHTGWQEKSYLVPGFFTDHYYPDEWRSSFSAWTRTMFQVSERPGKRAFLKIEAAIPKAFIFINNALVCAQEDMFFGQDIDITEHLVDGENELAVLLTEFKTYPHPTTGKLNLIDVPWGCCICEEQAGIWQDVSIEWRNEVHSEDICIRTSFRKNSIYCSCEVHNDSNTDFNGLLRFNVTSADGLVLELPEIAVHLVTNECGLFECESPWTDFIPWMPENPYLYNLTADLSYTGKVVDRKMERFGFKEVWIDGPRILVNGIPQRFAGEWCHKSHSHWIRPEYVRQWYQQIKDLNCNYVRMHTFPHPEYFLDIADEMGIFVCQESALHGSGQRGWETPELWDRARTHVGNMIRRDRNHPSLVLWSVENEMRWSLNIVPCAKEELPKLRALFNELDPTRPAYHDGDSSLWNEDEQPIISRHYGSPCHGMGWWEKKTPLHAGEIGRWHFASPYVALQWDNDQVYADYSRLSRSLAADAGRIIELARANEVSCTFFWNTSGLDNFRPAEAKIFDWPDPNSRYLKPLAHKPYESEYAWWEDGSGYRPGYSFDVMKHTFRPLAVVIREERSGFYTDKAIRHTVYVVNDMPMDAEGPLVVRLEQNGAVLWEQTSSVNIKRGCTTELECIVPANYAVDGIAKIVTRFSCSTGEDVYTRDIKYTRSQRDQVDMPVVGVWGKSLVSSWLKECGITVVDIDDPSGLAVKSIGVLIVAEHSIEPGTDQNLKLQEYLQDGGRALVLEQSCSVFPGLKVERMPIEMAHIRDCSHPAVDGLDENDLRFFGDDPFGVATSDSWVTLYPYMKPNDNTILHTIIDSSGGSFATGGLDWSPLIESRIGNGVVIASQLRLSDRLNDVPVAAHIILNSIAYLAGYETNKVSGTHVAESLVELFSGWNISPSSDSQVQIVDANNCDVEAIKSQLEEGSNVIVFGLNPDNSANWSSIIGTRLDVFEPEHTTYQLVISGNDNLLRGLSNQDVCWLDNWTYRSVSSKEPIVDYLVNAETGKSLLENARYSGLDVLYGDEQATEWKRMPALSKYFDSEPPILGSGLLRISVGHGSVIFCQVKLKPELWQFKRFISILFGNLGVCRDTNILAGDCVPMSATLGKGFPETVHITSDISEQNLDELLTRAKHKSDTFDGANVLYTSWTGWTDADSAGGSLNVEEPGSILVGFVAMSPESRKFCQTVGGLPNPDLQTFMRLSGLGTVKTWVNGVLWSELMLDEGGFSYVSDIDFEAGANAITMLWTCGEPGNLSLQFENKDRRVETSFQFS